MKINVLTNFQFFFTIWLQFVFCVGPCIVNYYNETKCVLLFLAVELEPEVDLAPGVDSRDNAVKKKPILERTRKGIWNIIKHALQGTIISHTQCVGRLLLCNVVSMWFKTNHLLRTYQLHWWTISLGWSHATKLVSVSKEIFIQY